MKKLVATAVLGLLTAGSLALTIPAKASALTSEFQNFEPFNPEPTFPIPSQPLPQVSESPQEQQVAYNYCYYEIYPDGSYYWVCWD
jgi:hypothetical protein